MSSRFVVWAVTVVTATCLAQTGFSQGRGGTGGGTGGTSGSTTGTTGSTTGGTLGSPNTNPNTLPSNSSTTPASLPQTIFLNGRVLLEDGTAPTEIVTIERVCNGIPHAEGYTDSKGYFGLQLGGATNGVFQDASEGNDSGGRVFGSSGGSAGSSSLKSNYPGAIDHRFDNCELRAKVAGYRSQVVSLINRRALDDPNVGTILLHRETAAEGSTVSAVSLAAPREAQKAFGKGQESLRRRKPEDAVKNFEKAVELYPDYAAAWCELGKIQAANGQEDQGKVFFEIAAKADPKFIEPYLHLAVIAVNAKKWTEVVQYSDRALKLDAFDFPQAFFYNAAANYNLKNLEAAEKSARQVEKLDTRHQIPQNARLLGLILARRGDLAGAADQFRTYLQLAPTADDAEQTRKLLHETEQLARAR